MLYLCIARSSATIIYMVLDLHDNGSMSCTGMDLCFRVLSVGKNYAECKYILIIQDDSGLLWKLFYFEMIAAI